MRIAKLSVSNFKGRTRDFELGPVNVVHGRNWSGKTAVLAAIRVGLLGYDPKLGKRNSDTFQLATGESMTVNLTLDTGSELQRSWRMTRGSVKATMKGGMGEVPPMLLDVRDYFGLSAQARRDHILSMLDLKAAGLDDDTLVAQLKSVVVENHDATAQQALGEVVEEFEFWCGDRDQHDTPLAEWMAGNVDRLKERLKNASDEVGQCEAVLQTIAQERAADPSPIPEDKTAAEAGFQRELETLTAEFGAKTAASGRWQQKKSLTAQLAALPDMEPELERLRKELDDAKAQAGQATPDRGPEVAAMRKAVDTARAAANREVTALNMLKQKYERQVAFDCCPTCGSKEHVEAMKAKLAEEYLEAKGPIEAALKQASNKVADMEVDLDKLEKEAAKSAEAAKKSAGLINKVGLAETVLRSVEQKQQKRLNTLAELRGYDDAVDPGDVATVANRMQELRELIKGAKYLQQCRVVALEREGQAADAEKRKGDAGKRQAVAKACLKVVTDAQQEAIDKAFGPFLETVRRFTDGVLDFALEYKDGDIGYVREGTWVSHATFSGAETALTYAGLGVALAARSPVRLVMLDEVLLTPQTKRLLAIRMGQLIDEGVLDQFLVVDVDPADWRDCAPLVTFVEAK